MSTVFSFQGSNLPELTQAMGLSGLEPPTSRLSGVRSNRLSYKPMLNGIAAQQPTSASRMSPRHKESCRYATSL